MLFKDSLTSGLLVTWVAATSSRTYDCPLAGPELPAASRLSKSTLLDDAVSRFESSTHGNKTGFRSKDVAWGISMFSSKENKTLYEDFYTPPMDVGVPKVDRDSIFRIGSVSKVVSVYGFLVGAGDKYFNDPITKWIPELAEAVKNRDTHDGVMYDDIDEVRWDEVTVGQLASQLAGIAREATEGDYAIANKTELATFGFPTVNRSEIPTCGVNNLVMPSCSRKEMFPWLLKQHPIFPNAHSPAYSNIAFGLLAYALEGITGKDLNETVHSSIFEPLGMKSSSFEARPQAGGVIPGDADAAQWTWTSGPSNPSGSVFMSTADLVTLSQSIMQSSLLSSAETRRWMKPHSQTGYLSTAVGAPWEIRYMPSSTSNRTIQYYTKQGDLAGYHTAMILSPEHELGWVVMTAGPPNSTAKDIRVGLMDAFNDIFIPAAEKQARVEAEDIFAGKYVDKGTNSSVVISVDKQRAGLGVTDLISRGITLIGKTSPMIELFSAGTEGRLFPTTLKTVRKDHKGLRYDSRLGFRAQFFNTTAANSMDDPCLQAWTGLGAPLLGSTSLDDWVFEMGENGKAKAVDVRVSRLRLQRET